MAYKNLFSKSSKGKLVQKYSQYHINDNILHVHIPKCGGTWLKDVIYDCIAGHHRFNFSHRPASVIKQELEIEGYNYDDFNTFAVVRNPWSRLWSSYIYSRYGSEITDLDRIKGIKDEPEPKYKNPYIYIEDDAQENRELVLENIKVGFLQNDFNVVTRC